MWLLRWSCWPLSDRLFHHGWHIFWLYFVSRYLLCLRSPIGEWESLAQSLRPCSDCDLPALPGSFLLDLLSPAASNSFCSSVMKCWFKVSLHPARSAASVPRELASILRVLILLQAFLSCRLLLPLFFQLPVPRYWRSEDGVIPYMTDMARVLFVLCYSWTS